MFYSFFTKRKAGLKVNGKFILVLDEPKEVNVEFGDFVEVDFLGNNSVHFVFDEDFLSNPPQFATVTNCGDGFLILIKEKENSEFSLIEQKTFFGLTCSVYSLLGLTLFIEGNGETFSETLSSMLDTVTLGSANIGRNGFIYAYLVNTKTLYVYSANGKIRRVFMGLADDFVFLENLKIKEIHNDIFKHVSITEYDYNGEFIKIKKEVTKKSDANLFSIKEEVLPIAFLEEILVGGSVKDFLCEDLKEREEDLKSYLGNFIGVTIPKENSDGTAGLVYKITENKYETKYVKVELENGKVSNVVKI